MKNQEAWKSFCPYIRWLESEQYFNGSWVKCIQVSWFRTHVFPGKKGIMKWIDHQSGLNVMRFFRALVGNFLHRRLHSVHKRTQTLKQVSRVGRMRSNWLGFYIYEIVCPFDQKWHHVFFHCMLVWRFWQKVTKFATWHENFTSLQELKCWLRESHLVCKLQFEVWKMIDFLHCLAHVAL